MYTRRELKDRAKQVLRRCLWPAVVVCLISALLSGEFGGSSSNSGNSAYDQNQGGTETIWETPERMIAGEESMEDLAKDVGSNVAKNFLPGIVTIWMYFSLLIILLGLAISVFLGNTILVGSKRFFMCSRERNTPIGTVLFGFQQGRMLHVVWVMFLRSAKTFLWTLLLVVPGIIKSYEYRMVPYILAENPGISTERAFALSREMMDGDKMAAFVLDLSFILWNLLGAVTFGLANIFFVNPYIAATNAELYAALRRKPLQNGTCNSYELPGF